jgi:ribonuclease P/MRP protein subunit POP5
MTSVPVKDGEGKNCVFRVVRVSGTIRKAEEEAIRRARELILKARREIGEKSNSTLDDIFGGATEGNIRPENTKEKDILMVDRSDSEEENEDDSDGDG